MTYKPRLTEPSSTDKHWIHTSAGGYNKCVKISGNSVLPNCVGYAYGRFMEVLGKKSCNLSTHDAGLWYGNTGDGYKRGKTPQLGAVICWKHVTSWGHVAIVEQIHKDGSITTSESGYASARFWTKRRTNSNGNWGASANYVFQGFIYNPNYSKGNGNPDAIPADTTSTPQSDDNAASYIDPRDYINTSAFTPFVVTLSPTVTRLNENKLKKAGVVGAMLYGGSYYDSTHRTRPIYRSLTLDIQVSMITKMNVPFGLYVDSYAANYREAELECEKLYLTVTAYPPPLGIWVRTHFKANHKKTNNRILDTYHSYFKKWGLGNRSGLICTRSQIHRIDWSMYQNQFFLHLVDPTKEIPDSTTLLEPKFFDVKS